MLKTNNNQLQILSVVLEQWRLIPELLVGKLPLAGYELRAGTVLSTWFQQTPLTALEEETEARRLPCQQVEELPVAQPLCCSPLVCTPQVPGPEGVVFWAGLSGLWKVFQTLAKGSQQAPTLPSLYCLIQNSRNSPRALLGPARLRELSDVTQGHRRTDGGSHDAVAVRFQSPWNASLFFAVSCLAGGGNESQG